MTIQELIERLSKESDKRIQEGAGPNGTYKVLEFWCNGMRKCRHVDELEMYNNKIQGFLYGLYGTYFITEMEYDQLNDENKNIYNEQMKKLI